MTEITISPATVDDVPAMSWLFAEMDEFYGLPGTEPEQAREQQIRQALFSQPPAGHALLARDSHKLAGLASYSFLWPAAGLTRSLYLKELYIAGAFRRQGIGKLLMDGLYQVAAENRCSRVEWTADTDNPGALAFYEGLGVPVKTSKVFYRIENAGAGFSPRC
jgi:GNAT superfamily N-acetyltransferase